MENTSDRPRVGVVLVDGAPAGWHASLNLTRVPLSPHETTWLTLTVVPPDTVPPGLGDDVVLACRPEEAQRERQTVTVHVVVPPWRVPPRRGTTTQPTPRPALRANTRTVAVPTPPSLRVNGQGR